jgi:hypothetical protein
MTTYSMTPISNGTRLRVDHNTFALVITSYNANQLVKGDEIWEAPADGNEVKKGDKWLKVTSVDGVPVSQEASWMAYIHKGSPICDNFQEITDPNPNPEPEPTPIFPESYIMYDPKNPNVKAEYVFVRIIEE